MSLSTGKAMLNDTAKQLFVAWSQARQQWDDQNARSFESKYLQALEPRVRSTLLAMEELGEAAAAARRDCA